MCLAGKGAPRVNYRAASGLSGGGGYGGTGVRTQGWGWSLLCRPDAPSRLMLRAVFPILPARLLRTLCQAGLR